MANGSPEPKRELFPASSLNLSFVGTSFIL
jgi:hypothetical protein